MKQIVWKNWINAFLGLVLFVLPVLGFPRGMKSVITALFGLSVFVLSFMLARSYSNSKISEGKEDRSNNGA